jgi:predicted ester cyclase
MLKKENNKRGYSMSLEENKEIVRRMFEAVNEQNLDVLDELMAPGFIDHKHHSRGLEALKQTVANIYKSFPDFSEKTEDIIAERDKVWVRLTNTGTHSNEFMGITSTQKKFVINSVDIFRIANGKIVEGWSVSDELDFLKKLGIIKYTEKGKMLFPEETK